MDQCGFTATTTDHPCENPVGPGTERCAAGHPVRRRALVGAVSGRTAHPAGSALEIDDLAVDSAAAGRADADLRIIEGLTRRQAATEALRLSNPEIVRGMIDAYKAHAAGARNLDTGEHVGEGAVMPETGNVPKDDYDTGVMIVKTDIAQGRTPRQAATNAVRLSDSERVAGQVGRLREYAGDARPIED